jgi:hypothetical protein
MGTGVELAGGEMAVREEILALCPEAVGIKAVDRKKRKSALCTKRCIKTSIEKIQGTIAPLYNPNSSRFG